MSFLNKQSLKQNTIFLFSSRLDQDMNANKKKNKEIASRRMKIPVQLKDCIQMSTCIVINLPEVTPDLPASPLLSHALPKH